MSEQLGLSLIVAAALLWSLVYAVQFAVVVHPPDAPDHTLRVLFMSEVRERLAERQVAQRA